ncbi:vacuolar H+-pyrophosphatase [Tanacetum coccineum]
MVSVVQLEEEEEELMRLREILQSRFAFWVKNSLCASTVPVMPSAWLMSQEKEYVLTHLRDLPNFVIHTSINTDNYCVAVATLGMLGTITTGMAIDAYSPICDNVGCIAEMVGCYKPHNP